MTALSGLYLAQGGYPVSQTGGTNRTFNSDGTNSGGAGVNFTPPNWFSNPPQGGIGSSYWIKFTDTGLNHGTATVISNNNVIFSLSTSQFPGPAGGIGGRNFSYIIYSDAAGANAVASGSGVTDNSI